MEEKLEEVSLKAEKPEDELNDVIGDIIGSDSKSYMVRNHYYFNDEVTPTVARTVVINLTEMALNIASNSLKDGSIPCPIELHINSVGGDFSSAMQIIQCMENIQNGKVCKIGDTPLPIQIFTHIEGEADSAASLIASIGNYRTCSKHALSLIHPMRCANSSFQTLEEKKVAVENIEKREAIYLSIYEEHSALSVEKLKEMMKEERYYTAEELMKFGLIEEIV